MKEPGTPEWRLCNRPVASSTGSRSGHPIWVALAGALGAVAFLTGCVTQLRNLPPETAAITNPGEGLVLGRIHLVYNGKEQRTGLRSPAELRWLMANESDGNRFLVSGLPVDGQFILKLPVGSYRITIIVFHDVLGQWSANLPATFTVHAGCTYLGTWELDFHTGPFSGQASGTVINQVEEMSDLHSRIPRGESCPLTTALLETAAQGSMKLTGQHGARD